MGCTATIPPPNVEAISQTFEAASTSTIWTGLGKLEITGQTLIVGIATRSGSPLSGQLRRRYDLGNSG